MKLPTMKEINEKNDILSFSIENINVSLINALRRTILSDIPCVVFRTVPYEKNKVTIIENTTRLNNEIIKHRMSLLPIHIDDLTIPLENYIVELDVENEDDSMRYITTEDFKIKNKETDKYLSKEQVKQIFPPNKITGDYIILARLRPKIIQNREGETLKLKASLDISTAKEDSAFNTVSTCSYSMTPNRTLQQKEWNKKEKELKKQNLDNKEIEKMKVNWFLHDAKRHIKEDAYEFKVETIGVYTNKELIHKACNILQNKLNMIIEMCENQTLPIESAKTVMKAFDIRLENEDYTIGKSLEYALHYLFYQTKQILSFVGFRKYHPHDTYSIIRVAFQDQENEKESVYQIMKEASEHCIQVFKKIKQDI